MAEVQRFDIDEDVIDLTYDQSSIWTVDAAHEVLPGRWTYDLKRLNRYGDFEERRYVPEENLEWPDNV